MNTAAESTQKPRNPVSLWILVALFGLPPMAAWLFFFNPQWLPDGRSNHGMLIDPPRAVSGLELRTPEGSPFQWDALQGQWTLALVSRGGCDAACIETLIEVRQIRRATGANRQRIERLLILLPDGEGRTEVPNLEGLDGTRVALAEADQQAALLSLFAADPSAQSIALYLIDPRIDLMMTHDTGTIPAKQILQDLEKLLKASQSWVKGGQYGHQ